MLADAGFVAVSIDAEKHGERKEPEILRKRLNGLFSGLFPYFFTHSELSGGSAKIPLNCFTSWRERWRMLER